MNATIVVALFIALFWFDWQRRGRNSRGITALLALALLILGLLVWLSAESASGAML